jgi:twitching motility two-component system response regulator PilG
MSSYFNTVIVGFSVMETKKIEQILNLTKANILCYLPVDCNETDNIHIILANADSIEAVFNAELLIGQAPEALLIFVGKNTNLVEEECFIEKPVISIRFLGRLNSLVASHNVSCGNDAIYTLEKPEIALTPQVSTANTEHSVLVVDDSLIMHEACKQELLQVSPNIKIAFAISGEDALEQIENTQQFDLILLDVMMPGIDGYQTCEIIRKDLRYKSIPIIMLSARTTKIDEMKGIMAGCTAYLAKPVIHDSFQTLLRRMLY